MPKRISIKETRDRLSELVELVSIGGKEFLITKHGKPKAKLSVIVDQDLEQMSAGNSVQKPKLEASFGMWKDRSDLDNPEKWVEKRRTSLWRD